ncbi:MAG: transcriptional regulator [marine bacterium B5-7]|nr:MAG: transcriptional regulator [marine bacterium B5-7]
MSVSQPIEDLGKGMLFRRLAVPQLERVAERAVRVHLNEGETLFEQQDPADRFYLLLSGQIKLYRLSAEGDEKVIEVINPGATFAEALMFLEKPTFPVGAQALKPSDLVSIDARDFIDMLRDSVDTCLLLAADLSQRLHGLLREINDLSLNSGTCRVASYFLNLSDTHSTDEADEFDLGLPKQVLASRLSIKPETLSRIFRSLVNAGLITMRGNHVRILDRASLSHLAERCDASDSSLESTFHYPR